MRAVVQRVASASVKVEDEVVGQIERGFLVLLGVGTGDSDADAVTLAEKVAGLRVFEDDDRKMNLALNDVDGQMLVVSQFTLLGDCRKGRRPSFIRAADPEEGNRLYELFVECVAARGVQVETGTFRAHMDVALVNDGPVTILLDSKKLF